MYDALSEDLTGGKTMGRDAPAAMEEGSVMRAAEVRRMLHIGRNTLYQWCQQKLIPHKKVGNTLLFSRPQLAQWIQDKNDETRGKMP